MISKCLPSFYDELTKIAKAKGLAGKAGMKIWHGIVGGKELAKGQKSLLSEGGKLVSRPGKTLSKNWKKTGLGERALLGTGAGMELHDAKDRKGKQKSKALGAAAAGTAGFVALRRTNLPAHLIGSALLAHAGGKAGGKLHDVATGKGKRK